MLEQLIYKYRKIGLVLDTNLLLFYLIGLYDPDYIKDFKRTCMYDKDDFIWLNRFLLRFDRIVVTPQILGEVWNFTEKIHSTRFPIFLSQTMPSLLKLIEAYVSKDLILNESYFHYVGFTDTSIIYSAKENGFLVLTDDLRSYAAYLGNGVDAININHLRPV